MPRSSGRSSSSRSSSSLAAKPPAPAPAARSPPPPAPSHSVPHPPPPAPTVHAPAPVIVQQPSSGGGGGIMSGIVQGMAMGAGSAIGRRAVDSVFGAFSGGSETKPAEPVAAPAPSTHSVGPCDFDQSQFIKCMQENKGNSASCDSLYTTLQQCQSRI